MRFTGTNTLYTPRVSQVNYLFRNIYVDSTGVYTFSSTHYAPTSGTGVTVALFRLSGNKVLNASGRFMSTYNTGEPFSVSGWLDFQNGWRYLSVGNILSRTPEILSSGLLGNMIVACPSGKTLACDVSLVSPYVETRVSFGNVGMNGQVTGELSTSTDMYVTGGNIQFYQSYEQLITGGPLVAYLDSRYPAWVYYRDNDTSFQNNSLLFDYQYDTSYNTSISEISVLRSGVYGSGIYQVLALSAGSGFSGAFDGVWQGSGFTFNDSGNPVGVLTLDFLVSLMDVNANPYPMSTYVSWGWYNTGVYKKAEYITGFQLTATGQYLSIPDVAVTGYYYSTGILQDINSLLFSSGCSGNLAVSFTNTNGYGTGASGALVLMPVLFSGVYSTGVKAYYLVSGYVPFSFGSGYTRPPRASVNTGQYGAACFDVPNTSGYNYAWYRPFRTSGTTDIEAGWFSGVALCATGLVSGGALTGYTVTGIDVYNLGFGYSPIRPPLMSFVRKDVPTGLVSNASGVLLMKTGSLFAPNSNGFSIETGLAGTTLTKTVTPETITVEPPTNQLSARLTVSGWDITEPVSGIFNLNSAGRIVSVIFTYSRYFETGGDVLKKKDSGITVYAMNQELGFGISENELDTLYNTDGYINNNWPFDEGDYDF